MTSEWDKLWKEQTFMIEYNYHQKNKIVDWFDRVKAEGDKQQQEIEHLKQNNFRLRGICESHQPVLGNLSSRLKIAEQKLEAIKVFIDETEGNWNVCYMGGKRHPIFGLIRILEGERVITCPHCKVYSGLEHLHWCIEAGSVLGE